MSTYRITVKYWHPHFGDGHVQFSKRFEARASKKSDQEAIAILENAIRVHHDPQGRRAEAWAERSDRFGPRTLRAYDGSSGQWVLVNPMRPAEPLREGVLRSPRRIVESFWGFGARKAPRVPYPPDHLIEDFASKVASLTIEKKLFSTEEAFDSIRRKPAWFVQYVADGGDLIRIETDVIKTAKRFVRICEKVARKPVKRRRAR